MNALLLPGNSPRHAEWIMELKSALISQFQTIKTQHYRHWRSGEKIADIEYEIATAKTQATGLEPYIVVGKSIGTLIAAKAAASGQLKPEKMILMGIPVGGDVEIEAFTEWLSCITVPVVILQNAADPLGAFSDVRAAFEAVSDKLSFIELPGSTHDYLDFEAIKRLI